MYSAGSRGGRDGRRDDNRYGRLPKVTTISRGRTRPNVPSMCKFKTEWCHYLLELAVCPFGNECTYAHSVSELRVIDRHPRHRTENCRDYCDEGYCPFGERCSFIHARESVEELHRQIFQSYQELAKIYNDCRPDIIITEDMIDAFGNREIDDPDFVRPATASSGYSSSSVSPSVSPTPDADRDSNRCPLQSTSLQSKVASPVSRRQSSTRKLDH